MDTLMPRERTIILSQHTRHRDSSLAKCGVYAIINKINGKRYIGSTSVSFAYRWERHIGELRTGTNACIILQNAVNKHGLASFEFKILKTCTPEEAIIYEQRYLDRYQPWLPNNGYNVGKTASAAFQGRQHTLASRKLMSKRQLGKKHTIEAKRKMREAKLGRCLSMEHRKRQSETMKQKFANGEIISAVGKANGRSKLTEARVRVIDRDLRKGKLTITEIAKREGVVFSAIKSIESGRTWSWLTGRI
jgi:group I intron endonuclease